MTADPPRAENASSGIPPYPRYQYPHYDEQWAQFGRDPRTGQLLSYKSKAIAGLLQMFFGWIGAGRIYMGSVGVAVCQLATFVLGALLVASLFFIVFGLILWAALILWEIIDGIYLLCSRPRDSGGRLLC